MILDVLLKVKGNQHMIRTNKSITDWGCIGAKTTPEPEGARAHVHLVKAGTCDSSLPKLIK